MRHGHDARDAQTFRGEGDRLAVIARAGRNHAATALVGGERPNQVEPSTNLEGRRGIVIFVFDVDVEPGLRGEQRMTHERRRRHEAGQRRAGTVDVLEPGFFHSSGRRVCTS